MMVMASSMARITEIVPLGQISLITVRALLNAFCLSFAGAVDTSPYDVVGWISISWDHMSLDSSLHAACTGARRLRSLPCSICGRVRVWTGCLQDLEASVVKSGRVHRHEHGRNVWGGFDVRGYGYRLEVFEVYHEILYIGSSPAVELLDLFLIDLF